MSSLVQTIVLTVAVATGAAAGSYGAITVAVTNNIEPIVQNTPAQSASDSDNSVVADVGGISAADYWAAVSACADLRHWGKTADDIRAKQGERGALYLKVIEAAGVSVEQCRGGVGMAQ